MVSVFAKDVWLLHPYSHWPPFSFEQVYTCELCSFIVDGPKSLLISVFTRMGPKTLSLHNEIFVLVRFIISLCRWLQFCLQSFVKFRGNLGLCKPQTRVGLKLLFGRGGVVLGFELRTLHLLGRCSTT
jgi:hypothetical protein